MGFLSLLVANWRTCLMVATIITIFAAGWHLRGMQDAIKLQSAIKIEYASAKKMQDYNDKLADDYEKRILRYQIQTQQLNEIVKVTYEDNAYKCIVPTSGLHILDKAGAN